MPIRANDLRLHELFIFDMLFRSLSKHAFPHLQALEGEGEARTWLIPLLRQHVQQAHLAYWGSELLPLARALGSRAALAQQSPARQLEAQQCRALELQLWNTLQSFCSWALDTSTAFR